MTTSTTTAVYNDLQARTPMVDVRTGVLSGQVWQRFFQNLSAQLQNLQAVANNAFGTNVFTLANQPALGTADEGYVGFVSDYAHLVYWDGTAWQWLDADLPGRLADFAVAPSTGWALCDGSATTYLTLGATLTTTSFTTPDLKTTAAYRKSAASYTGTITAASGTTAAGATGTGTTGTGTTGTGTTGTGHGTTSGDGASTPLLYTPGSTSVSLNTTTHTHTQNVPGLSIPGLSVPGLSVPSLTVAGLGVGTLDMSRLGAPVYVRR